MAYYRYSRFKRSRYRKGYYRRRRRYYPARLRSYRRRRRYYRKSRFNKVEYKRLEGQFTSNFQSDVINTEGVGNLQAINPAFYTCISIGGQYTNAPMPNGFLNRPVNQGVGIANRIGYKINPTRLKFFLNIGLFPKDLIRDEEVPVFTDLKQGQIIGVRFLVFQIRSGDITNNQFNANFSPYNPFAVSIQEDGVSSYYNDDIVPNSYISMSFYKRIFATYPVFIETSQISQQMGTTVKRYYQGYDLSDQSTYEPFSQMILSKAPFRNGIGGGIKILKDKFYGLNPTTKTSINFRCKTKKPWRMRCEEPTNAENGDTSFFKNPIYCCFIPVFPYPNYPAKLVINGYYQMYFTDI